MFLKSNNWTILVNHAKKKRHELMAQRPAAAAAMRFGASPPDRWIPANDKPPRDVSEYAPQPSRIFRRDTRVSLSTKQIDLLLVSNRTLIWRFLFCFHQSMQGGTAMDSSLQEFINRHYDVIGCIGEGTFSTVWRAKKKDTNQDVAIKVVLQTSGPKRTTDEMNLLLEHGGHDFIVECMGAQREDDRVILEMRYFNHTHFKVRFVWLALFQLLPCIESFSEFPERALPSGVCP